MATELLINNLKNSLSVDNTQSAQIYETHISWIILTGEFVYKIKKPVDFGFLDYSSLEKRKFYCDEEVRLNRILAPEIYLNVVGITGSESQPTLEKGGSAIEYAVKMREFPQSTLFSNLLKENLVKPAMVDSLAELVARFHENTPIAAPQKVFGTPKHVHAPVKQNFEQILPLLTSEQDKKQLHELETWSEEQYKKNYQLFNLRKQNGFIRDCHGDLHLGNIIYYQDKPIIFDRIEFNDDLRWTDVIADIAFLAMDFTDRNHEEYANRLLNIYFQHTGDYTGLALLPYYQIYRAIVRAKIALFRINHATNLTASEQDEIRNNYRALMAAAQNDMQTTQPSLIITYGLTGSGKSSIAQKIVEKCGAIQLSSDIERKRMFHLSAHESGKAAVNKGIYKPRTTEKVYQRLIELATTIISAGFTPIIDATFLKYQHRKMFQELAEQLQVPFVIINCETLPDELRKRTEQRITNINDPSDSYLDVLEMQEKELEPLKTDEKKFVIDHRKWLE